VIAGVKTIEHGDGGTKEVFQLMKDNDVCLCPTLAAGDAIMQYRGWKKGVEPDPERIVNKKESFKQALSIGVKICAGGDVGVFTHGDNVRELEMMVAYGMEPIDVLRSATSVNASTFELSELGQIKKGFFADLVIVNGNPIEQISNLRKVQFVMKDGIVYRNEL
jgi:imidazolonepropionase-like amidohydrolase